jgi:hypothetical protein
MTQLMMCESDVPCSCREADWSPGACALVCKAFRRAYLASIAAQDSKVGKSCVQSIPMQAVQSIPMQAAGKQVPCRVAEHFQ